MEVLTHVDLFSGIGGFALAAEWAGFETVVFCEKDEYCQRILRKHWPGVPIIPEIRDFKWPMADTEQSRARMEKPRTSRQARKSTDTSKSKILRQENREAFTKRITPIDTVTLITGGFPCQPFSVAGKRRGKEDDRYLWPEMFAVISEVRPTWVLAENVTGIVKMELDNCLSDLESEGYETDAFIIPACAVEAKHRRDRVWIVGHSPSNRCNTGEHNQQRRQVQGTPKWEIKKDKPTGDGRLMRIGERSAGQDVADTGTTRTRMETYRGCGPKGKPTDPSSTEILRQENGKIGSEGIATGCRWPTESRLGGMVDGFSKWLDEPGDIPRVAAGVKDRVNRLKALGNAIVPQVAYEILRAIRMIEEGNG